MREFNGGSNVSEFTSVFFPQTFSLIAHCSKSIFFLFNSVRCPAMSLA